MTTASRHQGGIWEQRWHPLREEWIVVAAHRQNRPWKGDLVPAHDAPIPAYLSDCFLCPGNLRVSGALNANYEHTFVFDNDHPCVGQDAPAIEEIVLPPPPYRVEPATGYSRVVCFNPAHNITLAQLSIVGITEIVQIWQQQTYDLGHKPDVRHILCFENKGMVVGVSNPHPHGQIYATNFVFKTIKQELDATQNYFNQTEHHLFSDIISAEQADGRRILYEDNLVIAFLPYFARYAYEVYIAPKRRVAHVFELSDAEIHALAHALKNVTVRFDNLWQISFPYVMALHQAPTDGGDYRNYHFFLAFHPPLRRPSVLKFLAGPEIGGGNFVSDTSPENKAAELLAVSATTHYSVSTAYKELRSVQ